MDAEDLQAASAHGLPGERPMWKVLLVFLLPMMGSNILQSLGGTVSSILLGRMLGVEALATVSGFFPVLFFLVSFVIGIGSGSAVLIGQAYGARDHERLEAVMGTTLTTAFLLGAIMAVAGEIFVYPLLHLVATPANILQPTASFARIMFRFMPMIFLYVVYTTFMRGIGDSKTPLYFLIMSTVLTLLFTPLLIAGWWGLPAFGVNGAAYASVIAWGITLVAFVIYLQKTHHPMRIERDTLHHLRIDWQLLKLLVKIGIPSSVQMVMISLAEIAVLSFVNKFGSHATAAYGAVNQIIGYVQMPAVSLGIAVSIFGAQAIGAGRQEQLRPILRAGVRLNFFVGGILVALTYMFAHELLSLFLTDQYTLRLAFDLLMITLWGYLIFGVNVVLAGIMRSSGTVFWPTALAIASIWGVEVPVAYVLSGRLGLNGIWLGYPAAFICGLVLQAGYYHLFWKRREHRRLI